MAKLDVIRVVNIANSFINYADASHFRPPYGIILVDEGFFCKKRLIWKVVFDFRGMMRGNFAVKIDDNSGVVVAYGELFNMKNV